MTESLKIAIPIRLRSDGCPEESDLEFSITPHAVFISISNLELDIGISTEEFMLPCLAAMMMFRGPTKGDMSIFKTVMERLAKEESIEINTD